MRIVGHVNPAPSLKRQGGLTLAVTARGWSAKTWLQDPTTLALRRHDLPERWVRAFRRRLRGGRSDTKLCGRLRTNAAVETAGMLG
eukprot:861505-Pyramimonas_sp.AAC.1